MVEAARMADEWVTVKGPEAETAMCVCGYRERFHEGRNKTCIIAGVRCEGFRPA